jgi:hypothetical protein
MYAAMGILYLIQLSTTSPWGNSTLNWTIPFLSLSISFNIIVTLAIIGRLYYFRRAFVSAMGNSSSVGAPEEHYTSIAAMLIESSFLTSTFSILCIVPFARGSTVANLFLQPIGQIQVSVAVLPLCLDSLLKCYGRLLRRS